MAYTNDYTTRNSCDAVTGWVEGGQGAAVTVNTTKQQEGTGCLELRTSSTTTGEATWYYDLAVGNRFRLDQEDLLMWFFYVKGKGAAYLGTTSDSFKIRCYLGGTTNYVEYYQGGDADLRFGWDVYSASGSEYDNSSGTIDLTDDVHRIMIVLDFANANNDSSQDAALLMDYWRSGTKITVSQGTSGSPVDFSDIQTYSDNNALGVCTVTNTFVNLLCGLDIGNGSSGTDNEGHLKDSGKFVLFNQLSEEVKHPLNVEDYSSFQLGTLEIGDDGEYAVDGCQLVLPPNKYSDINVKNGSTFKLYDSKVYRWRYVYLGDASDASSSIELNIVDFDSNETIYFRANTLNLRNIEIHDNAYQIQAFSGVITVSPDISINVSVYNCAAGFRFRDNIQMTEYIAGDNALSDLEVLDGKTVTLTNSEFNVNKLKRVPA